jgi:hypothetical protein
MSDKENIVDKVTNDDTKIVITSRSVKWVIGILGASVLGILGFAFSLYVKVNSDIESLDSNMTKNKKEIIDKIDNLDKDKIEKNKEKNHNQDLDIVRLYERVDSKNQAINGDTHRPETLNNNNDNSIPSIGR